MKLSFKIEGGNFARAGHASSEVKKILKQLGIDTKTIKSIVIALYEAEVNIVAHAHHGTMEVEIDDKKITTRLTDEGPGIPDIEMAMQEGFSTASKEVREMGFGAGMGLPNIKKNTDSMDIKSTVGTGTELIMVNYF
jgi:anti-sigma regulatory factor (Ser/Thr protein kinase)